ncbi:leucine-rich repeat domain-containing protein [Rickettsia endosymbiont of Orchestes rusci]|uniref:ribonuclease inhibitor n=1 Tax=Rickettsia endosymbiont of Orchestes rusci TaxID=3066250 RepID=UPI00313AFFE2
MKELIEFLEKRGLKEEAGNLRNGATTLSLYTNNIGELGAKEISNALKENKSLTLLNLQSNNIGELGAKEISNVIRSNKSLTSLDLQSNNIGDLGAKEISNALKENKSLTLLNLQSNNIGEATLDTIDGYLQRNKTIAEKKAESLNAEGNNLCSQEKYNEAIEKYKAAIKITKESVGKENKLYEENKAKAEKKYEEQHAQILTEPSNNELNELVNSFFNNDISVNICFPTISDEAAKLMANKLRNIATITKVSFFGTQISDKGIKIITEALKVNKQLEKFSFSCSDLGDQKISILAEILQINTLTHIYLGENKIGITGIKAIIEALKLNNTTVYLDLHNNNIGDEGAKLISEFLKNNNSLKYLVIALNNITYEGTKAIIEALRENIIITDLDLGQNNIGQQNEVIIEKYLQRNKNIAETNDKFQKLTDELNAKVAKDATIKDKSTMEDTIKVISQKTKLLINKTDIEQVTVNIQELLDKNRITKGNIIDLEDELDVIIDKQNIVEDISVLGGDSTFG